MSFPLLLISGTFQQRLILSALPKLFIQQTYTKPFTPGLFWGKAEEGKKVRFTARARNCWDKRSSETRSNPQTHKDKVTYAERSAEMWTPVRARGAEGRQPWWRGLARTQGPSHRGSLDTGLSPWGDHLRVCLRPSRCLLGGRKS